MVTCDTDVVELMFPSTPFFLQGQHCEECDVSIHLLCVAKLARGRYARSGWDGRAGSEGKGRAGSKGRAGNKGRAGSEGKGRAGGAVILGPLSCPIPY